MFNQRFLNWLKQPAFRPTTVSKESNAEMIVNSGLGLPAAYIYLHSLYTHVCPKNKLKKSQLNENAILGGNPIKQRA